MNTTLPRPTRKVVSLYVSTTDTSIKDISEALTNKWVGGTARQKIIASAIAAARRSIVALERRAAKGFHARTADARLTELHTEIRLREAAQHGTLLDALTTTTTT